MTLRFQYQAKSEPVFVPSVVLGADKLGWRGVYPDTVPKRTSKIAPSLFGAPSNVTLPPTGWMHTTYPHAVRQRAQSLRPSVFGSVSDVTTVSNPARWMAIYPNSILPRKPASMPTIQGWLSSTQDLLSWQSTYPSNIQPRPRLAQAGGATFSLDPDLYPGIGPPSTDKWFQTQPQPAQKPRRTEGAFSFVYNPSIYPPPPPAPPMNTWYMPPSQPVPRPQQPIIEQFVEPVFPQPSTTPIALGLVPWKTQLDFNPQKLGLK